MFTESLQSVKNDLLTDECTRLSKIIGDVVNGKTIDIRTPFLKGKSDKFILDKFYDEVFYPNKRLLNSTLLNLEGEQRKKFGSRSFQLPWSDRKSDVKSYFETPDITIPVDPLKVLSGHSVLRPTTIETSVNSMKRVSNSGLPKLISKSVMIDNKDYELDLECDFPCVMFTRTQEGRKTRTVWGYPFGKLAMEGTYFLPVFNQLRSVEFFSAYGGPDSVDSRISELLYQVNKDEIIFSEDYSNFDQSTPIDLIESAFEIIRSYFQNSVKFGLDEIIHQFCTIGLLTPQGVWCGPHGIPSGSWFTSIIGSLIHLLAQYHCHDKISANKNQVMGDDGVIVLPKSITLDNLSNCYQELNLSLNKDKTFVSDKEVHYLQRYYCDDYKYNGIHRGVYPVFRALNRLIHMERFTELEEISGADFFSIRAIAILENCKWHPMHEAFVKWVLSQDKYNLQFSEGSLRNYIRKFQGKTITTVQNQYSDNLTGLNGFRTIQILRSL